MSLQCINYICLHVEFLVVAMMENPDGLVGWVQQETSDDVTHGKDNERKIIILCQVFVEVDHNSLH